jgi:hypothetical protein
MIGNELSSRLSRSPAKSSEFLLQRGGDRTKIGVETPQIIDFSNRQINANPRIRRNEVHAGYTESGAIGGVISKRTN